jgi:iron complex transport system permease protein
LIACNRPTESNRKMKHPFLITLLLLAAAVLVSAAVGSVFIPPATLLKALADRLASLHLTATSPAVQDTASIILFQLRLPRTVLVAITGAALGGSGAAYQGLFRNPLADPYLIGVASGAGLGAVIAMSIQWPYSLGGLLAIPIAAFLAAVLTVLLVYSLARVGKTAPTTNLILAGVALGSFATALTSFLMLRSQGDLHRAIAWLLGGGTMGGWDPVLACLPYILVGLGVLLAMGHNLNALQFGDEQAQQLGVPVEKVRRIIIIAASLTTAAAVAFSGIIGFVGLVIPHVIRLAWGSDYRRLIPLSIISGAWLLLFADVLARVVLAPQELPVGIITALVGAPFFLWVLRRAKSQAFW